MVKKGKKKVVIGSVLLCVFGIFLFMAGLFVNNWRTDSTGSGFYTQRWSINMEFTEKRYGLITIYASSSRTWDFASRAACDYANWMGSLSWINMAGFTGADCGITGNDGHCGAAMTVHYQSRCDNYRAWNTMSYVVLFFTFLCMLLVISAALLTFISKPKKSGGLVTILLVFSSVTIFIVDIAWALTTDGFLKDLQLTATYPYAYLDTGFWIHVSGACVVLTGSSMFAIVVLPEVKAYNPVREQAIRKIRKLKQIKNNMPAPPGMQARPAQPAYGAGGYPPQNGAYPAQAGYPPQQAYPQQGYTQQAGYQQQGYQQQYPQSQGSYPPQGYAQPATYGASAPPPSSGMHVQYASGAGGAIHTGDGAPVPSQI